MGSHEEVADFLRRELAHRAASHGVPAAAVAVVADGEIIDHAVGVLNTATGVQATPESVFQIGSITKVWTATLVMQLVDEGLVELDAPIQTYLPDFRLGDVGAAGTITVRQLLSHQAGFEGDIFTDTGRGDDAIEKFVALLADMPQIFTPGEMFSYNNAGYIVLGLLVERLREKPWEQALMEHIAAPLGLERVCPSPYEAIAHRAAMGHVGPDASGVETPAPFWAFARSNEPAGSMLAMTARDLAGFARMHLLDGAAPDGTAVLSPASAAEMRGSAVRLPRVTGMGTDWGLGWELESGAGLYGHDGTTFGQSSYLRISPEHGVAVVLLTNGGDGMALFHDVVGELLARLGGAELPPSPVPDADADAVEASSYLGVFANTLMEMEFSQDEAGRLWVEQRPKDDVAGLSEGASRSELAAFGDDSLIMLEQQSGMNIVFAFLSPDEDGRRSYVHFGRALARTR